DIVAAGDHDLVVWLNDGAGRLTTQSPRREARTDGRVPLEGWRSRSRRTAETVPTDVQPLEPDKDINQFEPATTASSPRPARQLPVHFSGAPHTPRAPPAR